MANHPVPAKLWSGKKGNNERTAQNGPQSSSYLFYKEHTK